MEDTFSYLFPTEDRVQRYRAELERALREAWAATMGGPQAVEMPRDIIAQVELSKLNMSAAVSRPALRVQMQGPTDVLSKFMEGLDASLFWRVARLRLAQNLVLDYSQASVGRSAGTRTP